MCLRVQSIKSRMESGMNLEEAVTTQHAGKYDFSIRDHGQKKLLLGELLGGFTPLWADFRLGLDAL